MTVKKTPKRRNIVGIAIRELRLAQQPPLSQQSLVRRLAEDGLVMDRSAIARFESGERSIADYEVLAIARVLKVPVERLFAGRR
jgi:transcriptional regulator with XRE-family HTH domain